MIFGMKQHISVLGLFARSSLWKVMAVLLLLCSAYLVDGSFNPFLYFRF